MLDFANISSINIWKSLTDHFRQEALNTTGQDLGKVHRFLYLLLSYFYDPGMFIFRWSSNFVEKVVLNKSMSSKMASRVSYLVYYYCI